MQQLQEPGHAAGSRQRHPHHVPALPTGAPSAACPGAVQGAGLICLLTVITFQSILHHALVAVQLIESLPDVARGPGPEDPAFRRPLQLLPSSKSLVTGLKGAISQLYCHGRSRHPSQSIFVTKPAAVGFDIAGFDIYPAKPSVGSACHCRKSLPGSGVTNIIFIFYRAGNDPASLSP